MALSGFPMSMQPNGFMGNQLTGSPFASSASAMMAPSTGQFMPQAMPMGFPSSGIASSYSAMMPQQQQNYVSPNAQQGQQSPANMIQTMIVLLKAVISILMQLIASSSQGQQQAQQQGQQGGSQTFGQAQPYTGGSATPTSGGNYSSGGYSPMPSGAAPAGGYQSTIPANSTPYSQSQPYPTGAPMTVNSPYSNPYGPNAMPANTAMNSPYMNAPMGYLPSSPMMGNGYPAISSAPYPSPTGMTTYPGYMPTANPYPSTTNYPGWYYNVPSMPQPLDFGNTTNPMSPVYPGPPNNVFENGTYIPDFLKNNSNVPMPPNIINDPFNPDVLNGIDFENGVNPLPSESVASEDLGGLTVGKVKTTVANDGDDPFSSEKSDPFGDNTGEDPFSSEKNDPFGDNVFEEGSQVDFETDTDTEGTADNIDAESGEDTDLNDNENLE